LAKGFLALGSGLGLVFGAGAGAVLFALTNELWYVVAGAAIGLVVGSMISAVTSKKR
jgi:hypothetical protein